MNSLLVKLMGLLIGITIITGIVAFNYLNDINREKIVENKFQELNTDKIIVKNQLILLYRTIFYAYANDYNAFKRVLETTKQQFINNINSNDLFKSEGLIIKEDNRVYVIYGYNLPNIFKTNLSDNVINRVSINNKIYYVSYLKFKPFNLKIIFYDTKDIIDNQVLKKTSSTFKIAIIFIIFILIVIFIFIRFIVLKPIAEVIDSISKISDNHYEYINKNYHTKEFALVKNYFNQMIDAIKSREKKIKTYFKDQEKRELFYYDLLNSQENIIIVNDAKSIEHVNDKFFEFFEYSSLEEFLKEHKCVCDFFVKEKGYIYKHNDKNWVEYLLEHSDTVHKVKIIKNKKEYVFNISAKHLKYSDKIVITLNEVTKLEKEKEKVLELNVILEDYKKAIDAGIIVSKTDTKGVITYVNDEFCKVSGYTKEELMGKSHNIVRHPDVPKKIYKELWDTIKSGKIWKGEIKNRAKDGREYYVNTIIAPLTNKDGEIYEYIALREDITDLVYAIKKAQEAEQVKMLFLSNMSHEIRTPLNGILGFTELLLKSNKLPEKEKRYINTIHSSSQALLQIINDVLDISKIESGKLTLEKKEFRPICSFKQAAELFKAKAKEKNINFKIDLDFNLTGYIISDEFRIRQVISNLIGNAIKFTPNNGEIICSVKQIDKNEKTSTLCFSVKDTGIGIPKVKQQEIFKEFTQADNSVSRKFGGTGLGLSISSKIVEALGGRLQVRSEEGKGSEFYFCIEVENADTKNSIKNSILDLNIALYKIDNPNLLKYLQKVVNSVRKEDKHLENYDVIISNEYLEKYKNKLIIFGDTDKNIITINENFDTSDILNALIDFVDDKENYSQHKDITKLVFNNKVLVAEDNEVNQELIKILLDTKGIQYKIVNNGIKVVEEYKKDKFDLIFMDINMPILDGIEATKQIIKYEQENHITHTPIIALTANAMQGDKDKFLKFMDDYLSKPIKEDELNRILNKYLEVKVNVNIKNKENILYNKQDMAKRLGIPSSIFNKVLDKFLETIDFYMQDLEKAINENNLAEIKNQAHKIKGSMMTFDLGYMVNILKQMEEGEKKDYRNDFDKIRKELNSFIKSMKEK